MHAAVRALENLIGLQPRRRSRQLNRVGLVDDGHRHTKLAATVAIEVQDSLSSGDSIAKMRPSSAFTASMLGLESMVILSIQIDYIPATSR